MPLRAVDGRIALPWDTVRENGLGMGWLIGGVLGFVVDRGGIETALIHDLVDFVGMRVLEVGCGDGRLTWRYAAEAAEVVALDVNERKIAAAIESCPAELRTKVTFRTADINSFETGEDSFDAAILSYSL
ncbi:MAG: class I SAM-dependent methyltransferase [Acidimicrobiia bacterium]